MLVHCALDRCIEDTTDSDNTHSKDQTEWLSWWLQIDDLLYLSVHVFHVHSRPPTYQ